MLSIGGEAHDIDSRGVASLQVILMLWLEALWSICITWLLILSRGLNGRKMVIVGRYKLPVADARIELVDLGTCDEAARVGEKVQGHDTG